MADDLNPGAVGVKRYRLMHRELDVVLMLHSESFGEVGIIA